MNLVRAEFARLAARRFVQVMVLSLLAAFVVTVATTVASSHRPSPAELARAQQLTAQERANLAAWQRECEAALAPGTPPEVRRRYPADCATIGPDQARVEHHLSGVFVFSQQITSLVYFLAAFLALFGLLVGASFVGAELTSGGMTNLLLWRPRRITVLGTKLAVALAGVATLAIASTVVYVGTYWVLAEITGLPGVQTGAFWGNLALRCLRGVVLALAATGLGFGIATLGRHTAAALGVVAGYALVWEVGARIMLEVLTNGGAQPLMLSTYAGAWMDGDVVIFGGCGMTGCTSTMRLTWLHAGVVGGVLLALCLAAAMASFRRRDLA